jgi:hypothetical protein
MAWIVPSTGSAVGPVVTSRLEGGKVVVTVEAGPYVLRDGPQGERVEIQGWGGLRIPGKPALPGMCLYVALPPGTRPVSVAVLRCDSREVPGSHRIAPVPPLALLPGMPGWRRAQEEAQREWQATYEATYGSDAPYPDAPAWLSGAGTFRNYAYAAVTVSPFTYQPRSGRLVYHPRIELAVEWVASGADDPWATAPLDPETERRAGELFVNFDEVADLYRAAAIRHGEPRETFDYVIVTTPELVPAIEASQFLAWKANQGYRLRTVLTTDPEIAGQPGGDLAQQIRNFLRSYAGPWGTRYVLFVGDYATVPMQICYPDPDFHVYDPSDPGLVAPGTPTDAYYADLSWRDELSWDLDGDGYPGEYGEDAPDFLPEVYVGRIPVSTPSRITYTLDKIVAFEQDTGSWKQKVLHGGAILFFENQDYSGYPFVDGATCLDSIETALMSGREITHFSEQAGIFPSEFDWPPLTEYSFGNTWGSGGFGIVNWSGHGWCNAAYRSVWVWDDGDGVPEWGNGELESFPFIGTFTSFVDDDHPSVVFAISCDVGYPEPNPYGNLGIDLLTRPGWGPGVGVVSASRPAAISLDWKSDPGGTEQICYEFNRYYVAESRPIGEALYDGKFDATSQYGWDHVYEYMNLYDFNLYGDPTTSLGPAASDVVETEGVRGALRLALDGPNPCRAFPRLRLEAPGGTRVRLLLLDAGGRRVASLFQGEVPGDGQWLWLRRNLSGVAPGVYFVLAESPVGRVARKVTILR